MKKTAISFLIATLAFSATSAYAAQLSPVRLVVQPGLKSASLQIQNDSDTAAVYDIRIKSWIKMDAAGTDEVADTDNVITSRPVVTIPANKSATIRFVVNARTDGPQDNYRVSVTDITPTAPDAGAVVRVKSVLPLFVANQPNGKGVLVMKDGKVANVGTRHVRVIAYKDRAGTEVKTLRYILPGQSMDLPVSSIADLTVNESAN